MDLTLVGLLYVLNLMVQTGIATISTPDPGKKSSVGLTLYSPSSTISTNIAPDSVNSTSIANSKSTTMSTLKGTITTTHSAATTNKATTGRLPSTPSKPPNMATSQTSDTTSNKTIPVTQGLVSNTQKGTSNAPSTKKQPSHIPPGTDRPKQSTLTSEPLTSITTITSYPTDENTDTEGTVVTGKLTTSSSKAYKTIPHSNLTSLTFSPSKNPVVLTNVPLSAALSSKVTSKTVTSDTTLISTTASSNKSPTSSPLAVLLSTTPLLISGLSKTSGASTSVPTTSARTGATEESVGYDRELVIIFGVACGVMLIVITVMCILRKRQHNAQKRFIVGGQDIEIKTSKF